MGFIYCGPTDAAAPLAMSGRSHRRRVVECARRNDHMLASARRARHRTVAARADRRRETSCFRKIVARDQLLSGDPFELVQSDGDVCRSRRAGRFPAPRAIAVVEPDERRSHLIANRFAKTTSPQRLIGHDGLLLRVLFGGRRYAPISAYCRSFRRTHRRATRPIDSSGSAFPPRGPSFSLARPPVWRARPHPTRGVSLHRLSPWPDRVGVSACAPRRPVSTPSETPR